jgi:glycosyltransferase involved in cell wall biosynthesis
MRSVPGTVESSAAVSPLRASRGSWVEVVSHLDPKYGGLSAAVPALSEALAGTGRWTVTLGGFCRPAEHYRPLGACREVSVEYLPHGRLDWLRDGRVRTKLRALVEAAAGVHIHGLWETASMAAAQAARAAGKPYVVSAHGMLEPWAIAHKGWKKRLYARLIEGRVLEGAACLHALTEAEAGDYRRFGLQAPVAVIPNGVELPHAVCSETFFESFPELEDRRIVLFLGRLHPKKGLDILCEAWARLSSAYPEAQLVLAGPDFSGTRAGLERSLERLGILDRVTFTGMLAGNAKWSALAAAECFVLPSYSEGLSVSTLEAMGMGVPVLISHACHLPEVREAQCGVTIDTRAEEVEAGLDDLLGASAAMRAAMGQRGRDLVRTRYSWPAIGRRMSAVYDWLTGQGEAPLDLRYVPCSGGGR